MPGVAPLAGTRVLERLVLKARRREADALAVREQALSVGRDKVRHLPAVPDVAVEPQPAVHREDHPVAPRGELAVGRLGVSAV
jgi:hypothetical protein